MILGLTPGRSSKAVCSWLEARPQPWRDGIAVVAIDPWAAYAHAVRKALPHAVVVVVHFHLDRLGNDMLTKVRRRVTWDNRERRGRLVDPEWANRRRLLTARERLAPKRFATMWNAITDGDPTGQILAAYIVKEELRSLLALARRRRTREQISNAKYRFGAWCAKFANVPEILTLAETIDTWWPELEAFLRLNITNGCLAYCASSSRSVVLLDFRVSGGSDSSAWSRGWCLLVGVEQVLAAAVDAAAGDQADVEPSGDGGGVDAESLRELAAGEHAVRAEPIAQGRDVPRAA